MAGSEQQIAEAQAEYAKAKARYDEATAAEGAFDAANPLEFLGGDATNPEGDSDDHDRLVERSVAASQELTTALQRLRALGVEPLAPAPAPAATSGIDTEIAAQRAALEAQRAAAPTNPGQAIFVSESEEKLTELEQTKALSGCSPAIAAVILVVIAVTIGAVLVASGGKDDADDGEPSAQTQGTDQASSPSVAGEDPPADLSSFAGTWALTSGLQNPLGRDVFYNSRPDLAVTLGPSDAELTIEPDGTISGGSFSSSYTSIAECGDWDFRRTLTTAEGTVAPDGKGFVTWRGSLRTDSCGESPVTTGDDQASMHFWITGDQMTVCRFQMATPTSCGGAETTVAATFARS